MGEGGVHPLPSAAFPAKAGIQIVDSRLRVRVWIPACAGMAGGESEDGEEIGMTGKVG